MSPTRGEIRRRKRDSTATDAVHPELQPACCRCYRFLCARWKREIGALQSFGGSDAYVSDDLHGLNHRDV